MKVAHKNKSPELSESELISKAVEHESEGELALAAETWNKVMKSHPFQIKAYDRLMILYRKLKEPGKELKIINTAIKEFSKKHDSQQKAFPKKVTTLSRALLKATGLADKKGNNIYQPEELDRWKKRKELLLKRVEK
jgi:hypothetical protein